LESVKHIALLEATGKKLTQTFLGESRFENNDVFGEDLCRALINADIPLYKIRNEAFSSFLNKYTEYKAPSETTLRNKYVKNIYKSTIENIKSKIENRFLWVSIDETTDSTGRYVANFILGILDPEESVGKQIFLLNCAVLEKTNHNTIARFFDDSIKILGEGFEKDNILLFLSDAAPYMVKAAKAIQTFYPKITHVTCLAHGLHRVCEQIRSLYPNVDRLIANIKKVFLKAPSRVLIFKSLEADLNLPPEPITTRWGTWLEAVKYYSTNFEKIVKIFDHLQVEDAASIKNAYTILHEESIKNELIFIKSNYGFLADSIKKLETSRLPLAIQLKIVSDAIISINNINCDSATSVKAKLNSVLNKNVGFATLKIISSSLSEGSSSTKLNDVYTVKETLAFKFAPITSVDVERSFSMFKNVLRSNRESFLFENLSEMIVIYCNSAFK
jgi:hypothetical protein